MVMDSKVHDELVRHRPDFPVPAAIAGWDVEVGPDATGDDAVWVWVILRDDLIDQVWPMQTRDAMRQRIHQLVRAVAAPGDVQVYVRFRTETEHRAIVGEDWAG